MTENRCGKFDAEQATKLWAERYAEGFYDLDRRDLAESIAARSGLGVISIEGNGSRRRIVSVATTGAEEDTGSNFGSARPRGMVAPAGHGICMTRSCDSPIPKEAFRSSVPMDTKLANNRVLIRLAKALGERLQASSVGKHPAIWARSCGKALSALSSADAVLVFWGKGHEAFRWSIDHIRSHAAGGCVCYFNLQAMHPGCNGSKGCR